MKFISYFNSRKVFNEVGTSKVQPGTGYSTILKSKARYLTSSESIHEENWMNWISKTRNSLLTGAEQFLIDLMDGARVGSD